MTYSYSDLWLPLYADGATTAPCPPWQDMWDVQLVAIDVLHSDDSPFSDDAPYTMIVEI